MGVFIWLLGDGKKKFGCLVVKKKQNMKERKFIYLHLFFSKYTGIPN